MPPPQKKTTRHFFFWRGDNIGLLGGGGQAAPPKRVFAWGRRPVLEGSSWPPHNRHHREIRMIRLSFAAGHECCSRLYVSALFLRVTHSAALRLTMSPSLARFCRHCHTIAASTHMSYERRCTLTATLTFVCQWCVLDFAPCWAPMETWQASVAWCGHAWRLQRWSLAV